MATKVHKSRRGIILYDDALLSQVHHGLFSMTYWQRRDAVTGLAAGRGETWMISAPQGEWVVRHYRRGGMVGKFVSDQYCWLGMHQTRPWREWHLLHDLHAKGLPVPGVVAARVVRHGVSYSGDLITERIPDAESLASRLRRLGPGSIDWQAVGACIGRFHQAGAFHADLNAHNVMLNTGGIYLIDFDRGRLRAAGNWQQKNLKRFKRSLYKVAGTSGMVMIDEVAWPGVESGYDKVIGKQSS